MLCSVEKLCTISIWHVAVGSSNNLSVEKQSLKCDQIYMLVSLSRAKTKASCCHFKTSSIFTLPTVLSHAYNRQYDILVGNATASLCLQITIEFYVNYLVFTNEWFYLQKLSIDNHLLAVTLEDVMSFLTYIMFLNWRQVLTVTDNQESLILHRCLSSLLSTLKFTWWPLMVFCVIKNAKIQVV